jgi:hypothetical protein
MFALTPAQWIVVHLAFIFGWSFLLTFATGARKLWVVCVVVFLSWDAYWVGWNFRELAYRQLA